MTDKTKNEVATKPVFGGQVAMASSAALVSAIEESAEKDPRGAMGDSDFLNFSGKRGVYTIGAKAREINGEELWLPNIAGFEDGWICWKGGAPVASRLALITGVPVPMPDMNEFGPFETGKGDGWFQAKSMTLKSLDTDEQGYFKINSISGVSAVADLQKAIVAQAQAGKPAWPLLFLKKEEFTAKGFKNFKPVFEVYGWLSDENVQELMTNEDADIDALITSSGSAAPAPEEKPKTRRRL